VGKEMQLIEANFWWFIGKFIFCHNIFSIFLLLLLLFKNKTVTNESKNWLYTINILLPYFTLIYVLSFLYIMYSSLENAGDEQFVFAPPSTIFKHSWFWMAFQLLLTYLPGLFFFFKKLRLSIILIVINLLAQNFYHIKQLFEWLTGKYSDYLPSSWSLVDEPVYVVLLQWAAPVVVILVMYILLHIRKRLPNPSLFFKSNVQPL
jgi:hypothetical protein